MDEYIHSLVHCSPSVQTQDHAKMRVENFRGHCELTILTSSCACGPMVSQAWSRQAVESGGGADGIDYRNKV